MQIVTSILHCNILKFHLDICTLHITIVALSLPYAVSRCCLTIMEHVEILQPEENKQEKAITLHRSKGNDSHSFTGGRVV